MKHSRITLLSTLMLLMHCGSIFSATENAKISEPATWLDEMHQHNRNLQKELSEINVNLQKYDNCYIGTGTKAVMCGLFAAGTLIAGGRESCQSGREKIKMALVGGFIASGLAFSYYNYHTHYSRQLLYRKSAIENQIFTTRGMECIFTQLPHLNTRFTVLEKTVTQAATTATTATEKVTALELAMTQITQQTEAAITKIVAKAEIEIAAAVQRTEAAGLEKIQTLITEIQHTAQQKIAEIAQKAESTITQKIERKAAEKIIRAAQQAETTVAKRAELAITTVAEKFNQDAEQRADNAKLIVTEKIRIAEDAARQAQAAQQSTEFATRSIQNTERLLTANYSELNKMVTKMISHLCKNCGATPASFAAQ